jgi:hypothetical protein
MDRDPTKLTLRPSALERGASTFLKLTGPVAAAPEPSELRWLLSVLARWQGRPVDVVLCVDGSAGWLETWDDALQTVPVQHATIQFLISRATLPGRHDDDDGSDGF